MNATFFRNFALWGFIVLLLLALFTLFHRREGARRDLRRAHRDCEQLNAGAGAEWQTSETLAICRSLELARAALAAAAPRSAPAGS
jgi:hypothetical protein